MHPYFMELEARERYQDLLREADTHRLIKKLKAHRRTQTLGQGLSLGAILRRLITSRRQLKPQM